MHVQARLASSRLPLKDNGAKVAERIAALESQIASVQATMPVSAPGMRGSGTAGTLSQMVPISNVTGTQVQLRRLCHGGDGCCTDLLTHAAVLTLVTAVKADANVVKGDGGALPCCGTEFSRK